MFSRTCSTRCSNAARSSASPGGSPSCQDSWSYQTSAPVVSMVRYSQRVGDITSSKSLATTRSLTSLAQNSPTVLDHSHGIKFHGFLTGLDLPLVDARSHPESALTARAFTAPPDQQPLKRPVVAQSLRTGWLRSLSLRARSRPRPRTAPAGACPRAVRARSPFRDLRKDI